MSDTPPPEPASETPETRAIVDTFHPGRYREERLLEKCEELEKQRNALSRDLAETKRCSYAVGMRDADLKRIEELSRDLAARDARVKELESIFDAIDYERIKVHSVGYRG